MSSSSSSTSSSSSSSAFYDDGATNTSSKTAANAATLLRGKNNGALPKNIYAPGEIILSPVEYNRQTVVDVFAGFYDTVLVLSSGKVCQNIFICKYVYVRIDMYTHKCTYTRIQHSRFEGNDRRGCVPLCIVPHTYTYIQRERDVLHIPQVIRFGRPDSAYLQTEIDWSQVAKSHKVTQVPTMPA